MIRLIPLMRKISRVPGNFVQVSKAGTGPGKAWGEEIRTVYQAMFFEAGSPLHL